MQPLGSYGWVYGPVLSFLDDSTVKGYTDLGKDLNVTWHTNSIELKLTEIETLDNQLKS